MNGLSVESAILVGLVFYVAITLPQRAVDDLRARRLARRRRVAESGAFPVIARPALPYEGDGPGTYVVTGVVERSGTPTRFEVEARSVATARDLAFERGVCPSEVARKPRAAAPDTIDA